MDSTTTEQLIKLSAETHAKIMPVAAIIGSNQKGSDPSHDSLDDEKEGGTRALNSGGCAQV